MLLRNMIQPRIFKVGFSVMLTSIPICSANAFQDQPGRVHEYRYAIIKVPDLGGGSGFAWGMNDNGHIVGQASIPNSDNYHPFFWDGNKTHDLGTFGGPDGRAYDVNNFDWVVGWTQRFEFDHSHPFLWKGEGQIIPLEVLDDFNGAAAFALNDRNQIVGTATPPPGGPRFYAVIWEGEKIKIINTLGDDISTEGRDINENGFVAGHIGFPNEFNDAIFIWDGEKMIPVDGSLGESPQASDPWGLNSDLTIVGWGNVDPTNNRSRPFAYHDEKWQNMLRPITDKGFDRGTSWDINDNNQIVGEVFHKKSGNWFGFIWQEGEGMQMLNDLMPPHNLWKIHTAHAINKYGQIAATGSTDAGSGGSFALLLTPVEPELVLDAGDGPLVAGEVNVLRVTGAEVGAVVTFVYGKVGGGARIPGCADLDAMLHIDGAKTIGTAVADENGVAVIKTLINPNAAGLKGRLLQAYDGDNCQESQLVQKRIE